MHNRARGLTTTMRTKRSIKRVVVCAACITPIALGAFVYVNINWGIDDAYAKWGAAGLVIDYMRSHEGKWPRDWEALRSLYEKKGGRLGWSFEHYKSRINIDFNADPAELRRQSQPADYATFNVIWARWTCIDWGDGPNAILYSYFRGESPQPFKDQNRKIPASQQISNHVP